MHLQLLYEYVLSRPHPRTALLNRLLGRRLEQLWIVVYDAALRYSERAAPDMHARIQQKRLLRLIGTVRTSVPFYANYLRDVRTLDDFSRLPPITKHDIREALEAGEMTDPQKKRYQVRRYTSGSSGVPFVFYHDSNSYTRRIALYRRLLRWAGHTYEPDTVAVWVMRGNIHPASGAIPFTAATPEEIEARKEELYSLLNGKRIVLHAMASHLIFIADLFARDKKTFTVTALISYGETLHPQVRKYLEQAFRAPVFDYYASQELMNQAHECEVHDGVHVSVEWAYIEVLTHEHVPVVEGEVGDVVVTSLDNEAMPFMRYSLGDRGYWMKDPCPCGRTLPRLKLVGRSVNHYLLLPNGAVGDFISLAMPMLQRTGEIRQFQIIRKDRRSFEILVQPSSGFVETSTLALQTEIQAYLGEEATVALRIVSHIPSTAGGKPLAFVNEVDDLPVSSHPQP